MSANLENDGIQSGLCILSLGSSEAGSFHFLAVESLRQSLAFDARVEWRSHSRAEELRDALLSENGAILVLTSVATREEAVQAVLALKILASRREDGRCVAIALLSEDYSSSSLETSLRTHGCAEVGMGPVAAESVVRCIERLYDQAALRKLERAGNGRGLAAFLLSEWGMRAEPASGCCEKLRKRVAQEGIADRIAEKRSGL